VAVLAGWWVTEVGRQPWVVQGLMRTADATSPVPAGPLGGALAAFLCAYLVLGTVYTVVLLRMLRAGPPRAPHAPPPAPARPAFLDAPEEAP
jgi:cytochrome bd ubiquinol oxidase subunit I